MADPYDIFLDEEITQYLIDQKYLININTGEKEEVLWSQGGLLCVGDKWYNGENLLENFTFLNGDPCGIKGQENKINLEDLF